MTNISIITDLNTAKEVWQLLSPSQSLYDSWDFRYLFYQHQKFPLHFLTMYEGSKPIGVLPLQYNPGEDCLEFFGGDFMEDNGVYALPERMAEAHELYNAIDRKADLYNIKQNPHLKDGIFDDDKYTLKIDHYNSVDDFLSHSFSSRRQRHIRHDADTFIGNYSPQFIWNHEDDLDTLFTLNKNRLGTESYFNNPALPLTFHDLFQSANFDSHLLTITSKDQIVSVSFSILYRSVYYFLILGSNVNMFPGSGSFTIREGINHAITKKASLYDAGLGDCGWKILWHLEPRPQYKFQFGLALPAPTTNL